MLTNKQLISAQELDALLAKPINASAPVDKYFPLRTFFLALVATAWFIRMVFFTDQVAIDLFSDSAVREAMKPAIYFRGWVVLASYILIFYAYNRKSLISIAFGFLLAGAFFNLISDFTVFYAEKISERDPLVTATLMFRFFIAYLIFLNMRNAKHVPQGFDKWNPLLFLKK